MARVRKISANKAVYATKTGVFVHASSGIEATQLHRINNFTFEVDIAGSRQDIREFGQLARIGSLINSDLTPTCSFDYYLTDGENEAHLGFEIKNSIVANAASVQAISGILSEDPKYKERNLFIATVGEGNDAFDSDSWSSPTDIDVVGFGNSFITDYTVDLAVGEIPSASVSFDCGNIQFYTGTSTGLLNPSIKPSNGSAADAGQIGLPIPSSGNSLVDVLRAGQIELNLASATKLGIGGVDLATLHPQSVSISVPLAREPLEELGAVLPYSRPLTFPIDVTLSVNAISANQTEGSIAALLTGCGGQERRDIRVTLKDRCDNNTSRLVYILKDAVLDSQNFSQDLDGNETVDLQFSAQIGGANTQTAGIFISGSYNTGNGSVLSPRSYNTTTLITGQLV
jgi:hypothetical protein